MEEKDGKKMKQVKWPRASLDGSTFTILTFTPQQFRQHFTGKREKKKFFLSNFPKGVFGVKGTQKNYTPEPRLS